MTLLTKNVIKEIEDFENEFAKQFPSVVNQLTLKHHFSKGIYARELFIPAGIVLTGKIHKYSQLNIMSKGHMKVLTQDGIKEVFAPFTIVSPAGTKRIAYTLADTVWTTIHGTDETDLNKIEDYFIAQNEQEYLDFCAEARLNEPELPFNLEGTQQPCGTTDIVVKA